MGMSASQGRLLGLTARLSDLEFSSQQTCQQKVNLARSTEAITAVYTAALNKQKMTVFTGIAQNGSSTYIDATAANLTGFNTISSTDKQRFIKDAAGKVVVSDTIATAHNNMSTINWQANNYSNTTYDQYKNMSLSEIKRDAAFVDFVATTEVLSGNLDMTGLQGPEHSAERWARYQEHETAMGDDKMAYYQNLFCEIKKSGGCTAPGDTNLNSAPWLETQMQAGNIFLYEPAANTVPGANTAKDFSTVSWTTGDTSIHEVRDTADLDVAEATYNTQMAAIQTKDKKFDMTLKQLDTEHSAVQTEVESVKKVIEKNIESSFKTFG